MAVYNLFDRIAGPLVLLPNIVITSIVWAHAFRTLPKSSYSYSIQSAFAFNILAAILDMIYMYIRMDGTIIHQLYIAHCFANLFQFTCYMFGQTSFFYVFLPYGKTMSLWFVVIMRSFVAISTSIYVACLIMRLVVEDVPPLILKVSTTSLYATSIADILGMAYIVFCAFRTIKIRKQMYRPLLIMVFAVSLVIYITGVCLTYLPYKDKPLYFFMFRDAIQLLYLPSSYSIIATIYYSLRKTDKSPCITNSFDPEDSREYQSDQPDRSNPPSEHSASNLSSTGAASNGPRSRAGSNASNIAEPTSPDNSSAHDSSDGGAMAKDQEEIELSVITHGSNTTASNQFNESPEPVKDSTSESAGPSRPRSRSFSGSFVVPKTPNNSIASDASVNSDMVKKQEPLEVGMSMFGDNVSVASNESSGPYRSRARSFAGSLIVPKTPNNSIASDASVNSDMVKKQGPLVITPSMFGDNVSVASNESSKAGSGQPQSIAGSIPVPRTPNNSIASNASTDSLVAQQLAPFVITQRVPRDGMSVASNGSSGSSSSSAHSFAGSFMVARTLNNSIASNASIDGDVAQQPAHLEITPSMFGDDISVDSNESSDPSHISYGSYASSIPVPRTPNNSIASGSSDTNSITTVNPDPVSLTVLHVHDIRYILNPLISADTVDNVDTDSNHSGSNASSNAFPAAPNNSFASDVSDTEPANSHNLPTEFTLDMFGDNVSLASNQSSNPSHISARSFSSIPVPRTPNNSIASGASDTEPVNRHALPTEFTLDMFGDNVSLASNQSSNPSHGSARSFSSIPVPKTPNNSIASDASDTIPVNPHKLPTEFTLDMFGDDVSVVSSKSAKSMSSISASESASGPSVSVASTTAVPTSPSNSLTSDDLMNIPMAKKKRPLELTNDKSGIASSSKKTSKITKSNKSPKSDKSADSTSSSHSDKSFMSSASIHSAEFETSSVC